VTIGAPLVVERRMAASASTVYSFLVDAEGWTRWQGESAAIDARPGGIFRMTMGNGLTARGEFIELVPHRRVVFTWGWIDSPTVPPGSTVVEIDLIADGDGTLVRLTHRDLAVAEQPSHETGWVHYLGRLTMVAQGFDAGPDPGPG